MASSCSSTDPPEPTISPETAREFLRDKLEIADFAERYQADQKEALDAILAAWQSRIPFQTVSMFALPPGERRIPTLEENVAAVLSLEGGRCWTQNSALSLLLTALGYDSHVLISHVFRPDAANHLLVIVRDMTSRGSRHVADVACGVASPACVDLGFAGAESEVVAGIHTPYKYIRQDGWIVRCQKYIEEKPFFDHPLTFERAVRQGDWMLLYYFKLEESSFSAARETLNRVVYDNPDHVFNRELICVATPGGCFTILHPRRMRYETTPGGEVVTVEFESDDDIVDALRSRFRSLPDDVIERAVRNWRVKKEESEKAKTE